jgi:hypothetical protein
LIFAFDITGSAKPATARVPVTFEVLTQDSLLGERDLPTLELVPRHEVLARLRRGHFCFLARAGERVIQYCWFGIGAWNLDDVGIVAALEADETFLYDLYASEDARGNRIFLALIAYTATYMFERGFRTCYTRIRRRNVAALVGPRFFGFAERLELNSMRVLSCVRVYNAVLVKGSGRALKLLTGESTRMGAGVLLWHAGDRTGYRINLPRGRAITPVPWVPAANGKP